MTQTCLELISSVISLENNTQITDQDYLMTSIDSSVYITSVSLSSTYITKDYLKLTETTTNIAQTLIQNLSGPSQVSVLTLSNSVLDMHGCVYKDSNLTLLVSTYSTESVRVLEVRNINHAKHIMSFFSSDISLIENSVLATISNTEQALVYTQKSQIGVIRNLTIQHSNNVGLVIIEGEVQEITGLHVTNCSSAVQITNSIIQSINNSTFSQ